MKILFYATYPNQPIGYAKIGNVLSNFLASIGHNVFYYGISNSKISNVERFIDPRITLIDVLEEEKNRGSSEIYGVDLIQETLEKVKPDSREFLLEIQKIISPFFETCQLR
jgi:hypothetical protein